MNNKEAIEMMNRCKHEIMHLKAKINHLEPKAAAYDNLVIVLSLLPRQGVAYGEDLVYVLEKRIKELQSQPAEPANAQSS